MRINKLSIEKSITNAYGIEQINISKLGSVVALVGKNGSGKSRVLNIVEDYLRTKITVNRFVDNTISCTPKDFYVLIEQLQPFHDFLLKQEKYIQLSNDIKKDENLRADYIKATNEYNEENSKINTEQRAKSKNINHIITSTTERLKSGFFNNYIRRIDNSQIALLQQKINSDSKNKSISFEDIIESISDGDSLNEFDLIHRSAFQYLAKLPHYLAYDYIDTLGKAEEYSKRKSYLKFLSLKKFIKNFLNKELSWERAEVNSSVTESGFQSNGVGIWKVDNRLFNYNEFSDGEKILFTYALLLFLLEQNPKLKLRESIILIDEPELHLHPDSEIDLINGLRNVIGEKGQLIIATHSINILSHLDYSEVFMVKDHSIKSPAYDTQKESLSQLMGLEDRLEKLTEFLTSLSDWGFANFMAQCFTKAEVIEEPRHGDPQVIAFAKAIEELLDKKKNLLLDFGAGKGRLYKGIKDDYCFNEKINYSALEPQKEFHDELIALGVSQVLLSHREIIKNSFDFVVLCNVLHEIPLEQWIESLNKIIEGVKENGYLVIIEAKRLIKGEKIGKVGYLLLENLEMIKLFGLKSESSLIDLALGSNKISAVAIPKSMLREISQLDLISCLDELEKNTFLKIEKLRAEASEVDDSISFGRQSAFLSQQNLNSRLALKQLNSVTEKKPEIAPEVLSDVEKLSDN